MSETSSTTVDDLEDHVRPNISRIESYRDEVALARKKRWPYDRIAALLKERHGLVVSDRAVSAFCRRRGIQKGVGETAADSVTATHNPDATPRSDHSITPPSDALAGLLPKFRKKKIFTPREGPIRTHSNGGLDDT